MIDFVGWFQYDLPAFQMDRFEVTNRQYQEFLDQRGYAKREYWKEKFVKDGKEVVLGTGHGNVSRFDRPAGTRYLGRRPLS